MHASSVFRGLHAGAPQQDGDAAKSFIANLCQSCQPSRDRTVYLYHHFIDQETSMTDLQHETSLRDSILLDTDFITVLIVSNWGEPHTARKRPPRLSIYLCMCSAQTVDRDHPWIVLRKPWIGRLSTVCASNPDCTY